jgi:hypothetical protein
MLVIKHFLNSEADADYRRERDMYRYLQQSGCGNLFLSLMECDDKNKILVMERGVCDLKTFAKLRRELDNRDGPLTTAELLLIVQYIANAMQRLWREA